MLEYTLKRSKRKTLAAYVLDDGSVEVRAPLRTTVREIDEFVKSKESTLRGYIKAGLEKKEKRNSFAPDINSEILFRGKKYKILRGAAAEIGNDCFFVTEGSVKNQVTALYRMAAERVIRERVKYFSDITGSIPASVKINGAKTRWGSCSAKGALNFSWFLIMASPKALDYVVIHELSHMKHMDHSDAFWREVEKYEPGHKKYRSELRALSERLQCETW